MALRTLIEIFDVAEAKWPFSVDNVTVRVSTPDTVDDFNSRAVRVRASRPRGTIPDESLTIPAGTAIVIDGIANILAKDATFRNAQSDFIVNRFFNSIYEQGFTETIRVINFKPLDELTHEINVTGLSWNGTDYTPTSFSEIEADISAVNACTNLTMNVWQVLSVRQSDFTADGFPYQQLSPAMQRIMRGGVDSTVDDWEYHEGYQIANFAGVTSPNSIIPTNGAYRVYIDRFMDSARQDPTGTSVEVYARPYQRTVSYLAQFGNVYREPSQRGATPLINVGYSVRMGWKPPPFYNREELFGLSFEMPAFETVFELQEPMPRDFAEGTIAANGGAGVRRNVWAAFTGEGSNQNVVTISDVARVVLEQQATFEVRLPLAFPILPGQSLISSHNPSQTFIIQDVEKAVKEL